MSFQAECLSSDFYTQKNADLVTLNLKSCFNCSELVQLVTAYMGIRVVREGDVALVQDRHKQWVPVRLERGRGAWTAQHILTCTPEPFLHRWFPDDSTLFYLRDTYPKSQFIHDTIDGALDNCMYCARLLARFLFCSTDPSDWTPRILRITVNEQWLLRDTFRYSKVSFTEPLLVNMFQNPRCQTYKRELSLSKVSKIDPSLYFSKS